MAARFRAALTALLLLAAPAAQAGDWQDFMVTTDGFPVLHYVSDGMGQDEFAYLGSKGAKGQGQFQRTEGGWASYGPGTEMFMDLLLNSETHFTGFSGVTLRAQEDGEDLFTLFDASSESAAFACGSPAFGPSNCSNACYETAEDASAFRNKLLCSDPRARWVFIVIRGVIRTENADAVRRARYLIVKASSVKYGRIYLPVDATFRHALLRHLD